MADDTYDKAALAAELTLDEGSRAFPYIDSRGYCSIGIGRNLSAKGLSPDEIAFLFGHDIADCCAAMDHAIAWWRTLPPARQRVMINLCFNLGWGSFSQFHRFFAAMQRHDWPTAAAELRNSLWYGQVAARGPRVVGRLLDPDNG